jgi:hypothetical protein
MEIKIRSIALRDGDVLYHNGKSCRKGHYSARYASTGNCVMCMREGQKSIPKYKSVRVHVDDLETVEAINALRRSML